MNGPLRHVTITGIDLAASLAFYDATLAELGLQRFAEYGDEEEPDDSDVEAVGYGMPGGGRGSLGRRRLRPDPGSAHCLDRWITGAGGRLLPQRFDARWVGPSGAAAVGDLSHRVLRRPKLTDPAGNVIEAISRE